MAKGNWGESFLKSGLPLEHLTQVTFRNLGWDCVSQLEYQRLNRDRENTWFELDLYASSPTLNCDSELSALVECKYHDLSRYWFFLPHESSGRWLFDDRVLNCGPYSTLVNPRADTLLKLASLSSGGIVVSEDGSKQDNAVYTAIQQLVNGFLPCCLERMFTYNLDYTNTVDPNAEFTFIPDVTALVPMIVTNARLYRLKPGVTDLSTIRNAAAPMDVADELPWTWYYHDVSRQLFEQNLDLVDTHCKKVPELVYRFPMIEGVMRLFADRPNWIAIVNIASLKTAVDAIQSQFLKLKTKPVEDLIQPYRKPISRKAAATRRRST